jgi:lysophospholipase L1-like esterase
MIRPFSARLRWLLPVCTLAFGLLLGAVVTGISTSPIKRRSEQEAALAERIPWDTRWDERGGNLRIGMMGDSLSILHSPKGTSSELFARTLATRFGRPVTVFCAGLGGTATDDWLPDGSLYQIAVGRFKALNLEYVVISLGTNDALRRISPLSPDEYERNLRSIASQLNRDGLKVVINAPPWAVAAEAQVNRLAEYGEVISAIADGKQIFSGDSRSFVHFREHRDELLPAGVHPNPRGLDSLVGFWADAFPPVSDAAADTSARSTDESTK